MGVISRKPITAPLWVKISIGAGVATLLTVIAVLVTSGGGGNAVGKPLLAQAVLVFPLVIAAKSEWSAVVSIFAAFVTYFSVCLIAVLVLMRQKTLA